MIEISISITNIKGELIEIKIFRTDFEFISEDLFNEYINYVDKLIKMLNIKKEE